MGDEPATVLDDRYRLLDELGRGGMSDVFRATDEVLGREVAVKVLRQVEDPSQHARFIAEAQLLAALDHPGLVTLLDAGIRSDTPYLVMTLAEGPTLSAVIADGALPPETVARTGAQVAAALAYAHQQGVTHRDVKPSNILLCSDSRALLADFGIARLAGDLDQQHTRTGETIGSPAYLAPEQAAGEPISPAVDVYSLGLVLLEALTGERVFPGPPVEAAVRRLVAPPTLPASLPRPWRDLLGAMLARDPADRPGADEVAAALATIAEGGDLPAPVPADGPGEDTVAMAVPLVAPAHDPQDDGSGGTGTVALVLPGQAEAPEPTETARRRRRWTTAAVVLAALVVAAVVAVTELREPAPPLDRTEVPADVPDRYREPLQDLHDAIEEPR